MRRALLLLASAVAACSSPSGEAAPESATEAILGGSATTGFSLVGMRRHEVSWNCTGTLVAPDVVLAAAHCIGSTAPHAPAFVIAPGVVQIAPAFTFYPDVDARGYYKTSGARTVDRIVGFGTGRGPTTADNPDAALFHLTSPVARPSYASVAPALPQAGASLAVIGFGCSAYGGGGYFTKRVRAVAWDDLYAGTLGSESGIYTKPGHPGVVCPGDSGGPLASPDGATIYGVTYGGTTDVTGWVDVTRLRDAIDAVRFTDPWGGVCTGGDGAWCSDAHGDTPAGYGDAEIGAEVSAYLVRCRSRRPYAGPTPCACIKEKAGVSDHCR
jgi:hypothetical protein